MGGQHNGGRVKLGSSFLLMTLCTTILVVQGFAEHAAGYSEDRIEINEDDELAQAHMFVERVFAKPVMTIDFGFVPKNHNLAQPIPFAESDPETMDDVLLPEDRTKCRKFLLVMAKRLMKIFNGCFQEIKDKHTDKGDFDKYFQCVIKCSLEKVKMVDEGYKFSNATFSVFVNEHIPVDYHSLMYRIGSKCIRDYTEIITAGAQDPLCLAYGEFIKCMQTIVADQCKSEKAKF